MLKSIKIILILFLIISLSYLISVNLNSINNIRLKSIGKQKLLIKKIIQKNKLLEDLISFKSVWLNDKKGYNDSILILKYFKNFCKEYDIKFSLIFGTLLGYVRHRGFIPWDDDMDVTVENNKFQKYHSLLNNDHFSVVKYKTFYKLFLKKNKLITPYAWSWPFLDIFPYFEETNKILVYGNRITKFNIKDFYPLKLGKYENLYLPVPNNSKNMLNINYGNNWNNICKSGTWVHKTEKSKIEKTLPCNIIEKYE